MQKFGPDDYIGRVKESGKLYRHIPLKPDTYVGKIDGDLNYAAGGAAFLLFFTGEAD